MRYILGLKWRAVGSWNNRLRDKKTSTEIEKFSQEKLLFCIETDIDHEYSVTYLWGF